MSWVLIVSGPAELSLYEVNAYGKTRLAKKYRLPRPLREGDVVDIETISKPGTVRLNNEWIRDLPRPRQTK